MYHLIMFMRQVTTAVASAVGIVPSSLQHHEKDRVVAISFAANVSPGKFHRLIVMLQEHAKRKHTRLKVS